MEPDKKSARSGGAPPPPPPSPIPLLEELEHQLEHRGDEPGRNLGEDVWIEVIQKMDEVYNDLLQYEVALEEKNAALEESQRFVMSVLSSMSDILVVCDRDGRIEVVNEALTRFTGLARDELIGRRVIDLFADDGSRDTALRGMVDPQAGQALHDCELQLRAAADSAVPVSLNCTPRLNHQGNPAGLVITGRPVGELRKAYQALHEAHEDLKRTQQQLLHAEKMASLGRLVAGVAHELNNPISFVLGNVHVMQRYSNRLRQYLAALHAGEPAPALAGLRAELRIDRLLEDLPSLIDGTVEGAERTRDIVDSLKRFSAVDRDAHQPFNLTQIIERAVHWVSKSTSEGFHVHQDLPEGINVVGSPGQIQQVVTNLVQNAYDASAGQSEPRLDIRARRAGERVEVTFRDNGPGIPPEHLPHIFEPFFTTKPVGKGTGLGLAITYGIVERHGGSLTAANHPDGGALFTLSLPLPKRPAASGTNRAEPA